MINEKINKYLSEAKLKDNNFWDDQLDDFEGTEDLIDLLKDFNEQYSYWNWASAERYVKLILKEIKKLEKNLKDEVKAWYKSAKEQEKEDKEE